MIKLGWSIGEVEKHYGHYRDGMSTWCNHSTCELKWIRYDDQSDEVEDHWFYGVQVVLYGKMMKVKQGLAAIDCAMGEWQTRGSSTTDHCGGEAWVESLASMDQDDSEEWLRLGRLAMKVIWNYGKVICIICEVHAKELMTRNDINWLVEVKEKDHQVCQTSSGVVRPHMLMTTRYQWWSGCYEKCMLVGIDLELCGFA